MNRGTGLIGAVALGCALAISVSAGAAERMKSGPAAKPPQAGVKVSSAEPAEVAPSIAAPAAEAITQAGCRKVKVVYAGYGEASRAGCTGGE